MLDRHIGLRPVHLRWRPHLLEPGLAALPADLGEVVRRRRDRVGGRADEVAPPVAVIVDAVVEIVRGQELELPEFARERADHLVGRKVAALDDLQRRDQLLAEQIRPPAVIGERGHRLDRRQIAHEAAEVGLERPERRDHRRRHAKLLLDALEQRAVLGDALDAAVDAVLRHHAVGEFQEGLREDLLAAILVHHRLVVDHVVRRRRDGARRNAFGNCLALELVEPLLEARAAMTRCALRQRGRGERCQRDHRDNQSAHRSSQHRDGRETQYGSCRKSPR